MSRVWLLRGSVESVVVDGLCQGHGGEPVNDFVESLNSIDVKGERRYEVLASLRVSLTNNPVR